jgi:hypothetical protein
MKEGLYIKKNKIYQIFGLNFYPLPIAAYLAISLCYQIAMQEFMHFQTYTFYSLTKGGGTGCRQIRNYLTTGEQFEK